MTRVRVAIAGSTGSVGVQALEVLALFPDRFELVAIGARQNISLLAEQAVRFGPRLVALWDGSLAGELSKLLPRGVELLAGRDALAEMARLPEVDTLVASIAGGAGLQSTAAALASGKRVALANKESLVLAGGLLTELAARSGAEILPVDSEHSAIFQVLAGHRIEDVERLLLTASGGPLRNASADELARVRPKEALKHPTWSMGGKITIDSATLMNKGFEVIEARWLFGLPSERIDVVVHPESIVHSMVEFVDGAVLAQVGTSDMRCPLAYALSHPGRLPLPFPKLDLVRVGRLNFEAPDSIRFPALSLAREALKAGGTATAVLSGADECAVEAYLNGRCLFTQIFELCHRALDINPIEPLYDIEQAAQASLAGRRAVEEAIKAL